MAVYLRGRRRFLQMCGLSASGTLLAALGTRLQTRVYSQAPAQGCFILFGASHGMPYRISDGDSAEIRWPWPDHPFSDITPITTLVEDLYNPHDQSIHGNYAAFLCVQPGASFRNGKSDSPGGISIDRQIAQDLSGEGSSRSINLGYPKLRGNAEISNASADGHGAAYPAISDPSAAIAQYFSSFDAGDDPDPDGAAAVAARLRARRRSVLDAIATDIQRVQGRLAGEERAALDQYLTSIRELEIEANQMPPVMTELCTRPTWEGGEVERSSTIREDLMDLYGRIAGVGLSCGVARVASVFGPGVGGEPLQPRYSFAPVSTTLSLHDDVTHRLSEESSRVIVDNVHRWRAAFLRAVWSRLEAAPVGDGSLADHSLLLWLNTQGRNPFEGTNHNRQEYIPVVFVGNAGGRLETGKRIPLERGARCVSDAFLTAARAMGSTIDTFGDPSHSRGPIDEMLA
ncbi:MAG: DUF1552 domain-containing protein [Myxococcota bacterium]